MPECEAEERITRALFEMELAWGAGQFDYGKLKRILTAKTGEECTNHMGIHGKIGA